MTTRSTRLAALTVTLVTLLVCSLGIWFELHLSWHKGPTHPFQAAAPAEDAPVNF